MNIFVRELPVALSQCSWLVRSTYTSGISDSHLPEDRFRFTSVETAFLASRIVLW